MNAALPRAFHAADSGEVFTLTDVELSSSAPGAFNDLRRAAIIALPDVESIVRDEGSKFLCGGA